MFSFRRSKFLLGLVSGMLLSGIVLLLYSHRENYSSQEHTSPDSLSGDQLTVEDTAKALQELYTEISAQYYDTGSIDQTKMSRQALASFVNALGDPFSSYLEPVEDKEFQDTMEGHESIEGIGAVLSKKENGAMIEQVMKSSPAAQVGLLPLDVIIKVDDEVVQSMALPDIVDKIRGERGTSVSLVVARQQSGDAVEILEKTVTRDTIIIPSVTSKLLSGAGDTSVGYISLSLFVEDTEEKLTEALTELGKTKLSGFILDLRGNGGGLLPESVSVASRFLPISTPVVQVKYRSFTDYLYKAEGNDMVSDIPLVILVDGYTASASEIIALGIREGRCTSTSSVERLSNDCDVLILGTQTFGKGSIQSLHNLAFGGSLKLTIGKWYAPSGLSINEIGVTPDIILDFDTEAYQKSGKDNYIQKAISILSQN